MNWNLKYFCEFDKFAVKSYCAIHDETEDMNLGDITKVDEKQIEPFNMIVGGSPCQDFSVAGDQKGSVWKCEECETEYNPLEVHYSKRDCCPKCKRKKLDKSRSSLLVEWLRVIRHVKPNFGVYENVKNIVGKKFKETTFKLFIEELHEYGYNTYWKVLNAKDYGVPQNRERVYLILIKQDLDNGMFQFPDPSDNGIRLKDVLEDEVDEKYYLSKDKVEKLLEQIKDKDSLLLDRSNMYRDGGKRGLAEYKDYSSCTTAREHAEPKLIKEYYKVMPCITPDRINKRQNGRRFKEDGDPSFTTTTQDRHGVLLVDPQGRLKKKLKLLKTCPTLRAQIHGNPPLKICHSWNCDNFGWIIRIRKLTPTECWRLMGFRDKDIERAIQAGISDTQLYKQAGNSIVVDVLYYILRNLHDAMPYLFEDIQLGSFFSGIGAFEMALNRLQEER